MPVIRCTIVQTYTSCATFFSFLFTETSAELLFLGRVTHVGCLPSCSGPTPTLSHYAPIHGPISREQLPPRPGRAAPGITEAPADDQFAA